MKKLLSFSGRKASAVALFAAKSAANTVCIWVFHQPKLPETVKKLRKF